jgi:hypothetical protein
MTSEPTTPTSRETVDQLLDELEPHIDWGTVDAASSYFAQGEYFRESLAEFLGQLLDAGCVLTNTKESTDGA